MPKINADQYGNASFNFPLEVPDGTGDLTPELNISYSSSGGNGLLGKGYGLSGISYIKRDISYGINYNSNDSYYSSEYGQLVDSNGNKSVYYSKEERFVSFFPQGDSGRGPTEIIAYDKDGNKYSYGGSGAQLLHPNGAVRTWALREKREPHGETINYEWEVRKGELYLTRISYAGGVREVRIEYTTREDVETDYSEKTLTTRDWLISRIRFYSDNSHVHSYEFSYSNDAKTKVSLLTKIQFEKDNFFSLATHLPLEFIYTPSHEGIGAKLNSGSESLSGGYGSLGDIIDRAFLMDRELLYNLVAFFIGKPSIREEARQDLNTFATQLGINNKGLKFGTISGGGTSEGFNANAELIQANQYYPEVELLGRYPIGNKYRQACDVGVVACLCTAFPGCPDFAFAYCGQYVIFSADGCNNGVVSPGKVLMPTDLDGDGIAEFSRLLGRMDNDQVFLKTDDLKNNRSTESPRFPIKYNTFFTLADIDGDGTTDFLFEQNSKLNISFSNGSGLTNPIAYSNITLNPASQNYRLTQNYQRVDHAVDINNDGRNDFIHLTNDRMSIFISQGKSFKAEKIIWYGGNRSLVQETLDTNPFVAHRMNQFSDIDGDRVPEHLQILNVNPPPEQNLLLAVKERHKQEIADAQAEVNYFKEQMQFLINGGYGDFFHVRYIESSIIYEWRWLYWELLGRPGTATESEKAQLIEAIDRQFFEVKYKDLVQRQANEIDIEISRMRNVNLDGAQYQLVSTKINLATNSLSQSAINLPKSMVGYNGKNWLVDINRDGLPDLVTLTNSNSHFNPYDYGVENPAAISSTLNVVFNKGGYFDTNEIVTSGMPTIIKPDRFAERDDPNLNAASSFDFVDVNEDGKYDFVVKEFKNTSYHIYTGDGKGNFIRTSDFSVESHEIAESRFEDRNEDGIPDFFYQYGKSLVTKQISSDTPTATGGMLSKVINNINGAETSISYLWKKNMQGAVLKGTGSYTTTLPNVSPQLLVASISSKAGLEYANYKSEYSYANFRYRPGDLETSQNLGFETVTETNFVNGEIKGKRISSYIHNGSNAGLLSKLEIYTGNNTLLERNAYAYSVFNPHTGTRLRIPTLTTKEVFENGNLKDQITNSITYDQAFAYSQSSAVEDFNGRVTRLEMHYSDNSAMNILALPIESKKTVNGSLVEHKKWTYNGADVASESKLVSFSQWYSIYYSYDEIGNVSSTTDSLGRSLSYEYNDITRSKATLIRNALGQISRKRYDPKLDLEISFEDSNGNISSHEFDYHGRKISSYLDSRKVESYEYDFDGSLLSTKQTTHTDEGDVWVKEYKNLEGKVLKKESLVAEGVVSTTQYVFDSLGREIKKSNSYFTGESPLWKYTFYFNQNEDTQERIKEVIAATGEISKYNYGIRSIVLTITNQSEVIRTETQNLDNWGRVISKSIQGESILYQYDNSNNIIRIADPGNGITEISYDIGGRKTRYSDSNSGAISYAYNVAGDLITQSDSRGTIIRNEVDGLGRVTKVFPGNENPIIYNYDSGNSIGNTNTIGMLSMITDESGVTELAYDRKGNIIGEKRTVDDLQILFQRTYDQFGRVKTITYPEGTKIRNHYTGTGQLAFLTMDSHDGNSLNHTVVSYEGPVLENDKYFIERKTGNGIKTKIGYDPLRKRPLSLVTYLKDNSVEQSIKYEYDMRGNISAISDLVNESRSQRFDYDHLNRVTKAVGKYGEEQYEYSQNGNLLKKGAFTYSYDNGNHIHAVTKVNGSNTGIIGYNYDAMGNMIGRNGDHLVYNAQNKLKRIETMGGDRFEYTYDYSGSRIKKSLQNSNTTTYSFGNFYEIHRTPGQEEKHTLYVVGIEGDIVAQYSRPDAILIASMASNDIFANPFCENLNIDCKTFWKNRIGITIKSLLEETNIYVDGKLKEGHRSLPWLALLAFLILLVYKTRSESNDKNPCYYSFDNFGISILPKFICDFRNQIPRYGTAILIVVFSFTTTTGCFPLLLGGAESESGTPIWLIGLGNGIPLNTPSVGDTPSNGGTIGGGSSNSTSRVSGMYFFHPDHLGSITMITDGNGNVLAGGERGGKSHITYKPYGEILRTDSYGPDITKYKFTGQEEDQESGLYYYKSRYYDSTLGKFASNDGVVFPEKEQGMNRMMYVDGNPIKHKDYTGNGISPPLAFALVNYFLAPEEKKVQAFLDGWNTGKNLKKERERIKRVNSIYLGVVKFGMVLTVVGGILANFPATAKIGVIFFYVGVAITSLAVSLNPNYVQDQRAANVSANCSQAIQIASYYKPTMTQNNTTSVGIQNDPIKKIEQDKYEKLQQLQIYRCSGAGVTESID
ncbi:RHS repeat-associated core domain protein [Leptospira ellinghausenii]|uniref:RHS repeat-associated core domain protein n=2 Tax=Leptospira ellinghausenii TaxID=1917822 RepID=A0A2P2DIQ4_9LEPT|nr:RHS repeat-associated core domain protein [Leptospira ellinghausenii]